MPRRLVRWQRPQGEQALRVVGAFVLFQDITEALRTQRELESKMAMIREVHHRVKNNLQIVASIMRMQARRTQSAEARSVLEEAVGRVMSVAVVHEFLSQNAQGLINLEEVAHRIIAQTRSGLIGPEQHVELTVEGPDIWLPAERATQCALVINELVQNAIEHGMAGRERGVVKTSLSDLGDSVEITVVDDGAGLPEGFSLEPNANLGLRIVQSIVSRDLNGTLELHSDAGSGTRAVMRFNKLVRV